jgi:hypothetical protein
VARADAATEAARVLARHVVKPQFLRPERRPARNVAANSSGKHRAPNAH